MTASERGLHWCCWHQVCFNQLKFLRFNNCLWWLLLNLMLLLWLHRLHALSKLTFFKQATRVILQICCPWLLLPLCGHIQNFEKIQNVNHSEVREGHCKHFRAIILASCVYCVLPVPYNVRIVPILVAFSVKFIEFTINIMKNYLAVLVSPPALDTLHTLSTPLSTHSVTTEKLQHIKLKSFLF